MDTAKKILIVIIVLLIAAMVGVYAFVFMPKPSGQPQTSQTGQDNNLGSFDNSTSIPISTSTQSGQGSQPGALPDIASAYASLFSQLNAKPVSFVEVTATSTGDYKALYAFYASDLKAQLAANPSAVSAISVALVDLTGDGTPEALVYENLPYFCGTAGCNLDIYAKQGTAWKKIASDVVQGEVGVSNLIVNGWSDLYITVPVVGQDGHSAVVRYRWGSSTYQEMQVVAAWDGSAFQLAQ